MRCVPSGPNYGHNVIVSETGSTIRQLGSLFWVGLSIRVVLILLFTPETYSNWWLPFIAHWSDGAWLDPWESFIAAGGDSRAFPYGMIYLLVFGPLTIVGALFGTYGAAVGLACSVLVLDLLMYRLVGRFSARIEDNRHAALYYWLNPVTLYVCYWHGQLDVLPVLMVVMAALIAHRQHYFQAGVILGLAVGAKYAMALAVPFMLIWGIRDVKYRTSLTPMSLGLLTGLIPMLANLAAPGFTEMALRTPESAKLFEFSFNPIGDNPILILPLLLALLLLATWSIARFTTRLIITQITLGFLLVYLLTPASPGWSLWVVPFLSILMPRHLGFDAVTLLAFNFLIVAMHLGQASSVTPFWLNGPYAAIDYNLIFNSEQFSSLIATAMFASGMLVVAQIIRRDIFQDAFFRSSRQPIFVGIAGDSGSGKDTLANALINIFGQPRTAHVSGDDYHLWDRHKPMWKAFTHLNPQANLLGLFFQDLGRLVSGKRVMKRQYDHAEGRLTRPKPLDAREFVIACGLHALSDQETNHAMDLKIFLAMDSKLRTALKIQRDVLERGHTLESVLKSLDQRAADAARFVEPQMSSADIVFSLRPSRSEKLELLLQGQTDQIQELDFRLAVGFRDEAHLDDLLRALISVLGAKVQPIGNQAGFKWLEIECPVPYQSTKGAVLHFYPEIIDFIALHPKWADGLLGIMQLVVIDFICRRREINQIHQRGQ